MRRTISLAAMLALSMGSLASNGALAQETHYTASIHAGTCANPGGPVAPLSDILVQPPGDEADAPIMSSITTVPMLPDDLQSADHSIAISESADDTSLRIACGDIGGVGADAGERPIALHGVGTLDQVGLAWLSDDGEGGTVVRIVLFGALSAPDPVGRPEPASCTSEHDVTLGQELFYAGWDVTIEDASFDPESGAILIDGLFTNDTKRGDLRGRSIGVTFIEWDRRIVPLSLEEVTTFISGQTVRGVLTNATAARFPADFSFCDATLTFGRPTEYQTTLGLWPGAVAEGAAIRPLDATGKARLRGLSVRFRLHGGFLMPAECGTRRGKAYYKGPLTTDMVSIVLDVTENIGNVSGSITKSLLSPDGVKWPIETRRVKGPRRNERQYCVVVPAPAEGRYVLVFEGGRRTGRTAFEISTVEEGGSRAER